MRVWAADHRRVLPGSTRRKKTAVSIPDPIFEAADRLARRRGISRSALFAEALELLLANQSDADAETTRRLDEVVAEPDGTLDPFMAAAQAEVLGEEW